MHIDTSQVTTFEKGAKQLLLLAAGSLVFVLMGLWIISLGADDLGLMIIGYASVAFFGLCLVLAVTRLFKGPKQVVTLSPEGFKDIRVCSDGVPWSALRDVGTWEYKGQKIMVLGVDPEIEATLKLTRIAKMSRKANKALGADGLCIASTDLKVDYETLFNTTLQYVAAHAEPLRR